MKMQFLTIRSTIKNIRKMLRNPFSNDESDRFEIWEMLVHRDIMAFVQQDWSMIADDFIEENFMGIDAGGHSDPNAWKLKFPDLQAYKKSWLEQAKSINEIKWEEDIEAALYRITILKDIEINGKGALAHKWFFGDLSSSDGKQKSMNWQTLYRCRKINDKWKIAGFTGYIPHQSESKKNCYIPGKEVPAGASQHKTAGPYSPVLQINPKQLVVISGQAAINPEGTVRGETIEKQTKLTLENCRNQLASVRCSLDDVFKVKVYMKDLDEWARFNKIYKEYFVEPRPVRTAVQAGLLTGLLVEIEMWAVKR